MVDEFWESIRDGIDIALFCKCCPDQDVKANLRHAGSALAKAWRIFTQLDTPDKPPVPAELKQWLYRLKAEIKKIQAARRMRRLRES